MHYSETPPPSPLDRWVRCFWFLRVEGGCGGAGGAEPVVPDGRLEIVLHRAEPFGRVTPADPGEEGGGRSPVDDVAPLRIDPQARTMLSGQLTGPIQLAALGPADIVGIRFRTVGARAALALPLFEVTDHVLPLTEVDPELERRLHDAAHAPDPVAALTTTLLERIRSRRSQPVRQTSVVAAAALEQGAGVGEAARLLGMSERTLERHLSEDVGLSPKLLQRIQRFRRFYALVTHSGMTRGEAAQEAGYYDHPHAIRDFRDFAGASPADHLALGAELAAAFLSDSSKTNG